MEAGINPAIDVGRFLADMVGFANAPALLGSVEFIEGDKRYAIATVHALVENQGDGWTVSSAYLDRFIDDHRVLASIGSVGDAFDNAMAESFFATLECEVLDRNNFHTREEARSAIFSWIEGWYNTHRRHSSLGYLSPREFERRFT